MIITSKNYGSTEELHVLESSKQGALSQANGLNGHKSPDSTPPLSRKTDETAQKSLEKLPKKEDKAPPLPPITSKNTFYLTWQTDPTTTMIIQWITPQNEPTGTVKYRKADSDEPWHTVASTRSNMPENMPFYIHRIHLSHLEPGAKYAFSINSDEEHFFKTLPADLSEPLTFVAGGDTSKQFAMFEETNREVIKHKPAFVVFGGDLAYAQGSKESPLGASFSYWMNWFDIWSKTMVTTDNEVVPFITTIGNHDVDGGFDQTPAQASYFYNFFPLPQETGCSQILCGDYLSLVLLDSGHTHPVQGEQTKWLESALSKVQGKVAHSFACYHVPAYPSRAPMTEERSTEVREHWTPIFEKYGLNIGFENHDHAYKRTKPLTGQQEDPANGVLYIGDGSWGVKTKQPKKGPAKDYLAKALMERAFIKVEISKTTRIISAISPQGAILDAYDAMAHNDMNKVI